MQLEHLKTKRITTPISPQLADKFGVQKDAKNLFDKNCIKHFVNKEAKMTKDNMDQCKNEMKERLERCEKWGKVAKERRKNNKKWEKTCVSSKMHDNLCVCAEGHFVCAQMVLDLDDGPWCAPFLHSNTSSIP